MMSAVRYEGEGQIVCFVEERMMGCWLGKGERFTRRSTAHRRNMWWLGARTLNQRADGQ